MDIFTKEKVQVLFNNLKKIINNQLETLSKLISRFDELNKEQKLKLSKSLNRLQTTFDITNDPIPQIFPVIPDSKREQNQILNQGKNIVSTIIYFDQRAQQCINIIQKFYCAIDLDQTLDFYYSQLLKQKQIQITQIFEQIFQETVEAIESTKVDLEYINEKYYEGYATLSEDSYLKHGMGVYFDENKRLIALGAWKENQIVYGILIKLKQNDEVEELKVGDMGQEQQKYFQ